MRDLFALLKKTSKAFSKVEDDYKKEFENLNAVVYDDTVTSLDHAFQERIIGKNNNLMDIVYFKKGLELSKTVCRIIEYHGENRHARGTGFLIGEQLLMTNNHVIENMVYAKALAAEFEYEKGTNGDIEQTAIFKICPEDFFITNDELDYTIVALEPIAMNDPQKKLSMYGYNQLSSSKGKIKIRGAVSIIQHPEGQPKMVAIRENKVVLVKDSLIHYTTDTQKGSSGSLVANDNWEIIALHRAGVPEVDEKDRIRLKKGGIWRSNADTPFINWIANQGVMIDAILRDISLQKVPNDQKHLKDQILQNFTPKENKASYRLPGRK